MYWTSMLPSKVMPYLLRLEAPLMDSSIVQRTMHKGNYFVSVSNASESSDIYETFYVNIEI